MRFDRNDQTRTFVRSHGDVPRPVGHVTLAQAWGVFPAGSYIANVELCKEFVSFVETSAPGTTSLKRLAATEVGMEIIQTLDSGRESWVLWEEDGQLRENLLGPNSPQERSLRRTISDDRLPWGLAQWLGLQPFTKYVFNGLTCEVVDRPFS